MSENMKKTIEYIKEMVGNHTDNDIYNALKESNMDIHDATHKLLHQDTFHEVRKRRDKKKENLDYSDQAETRRHNDYRSHEPKFPSGRNGLRGGYSRRGISREFRNVRDCRVNQNYAKETTRSPHIPLSSMARRIYNVPERSAYEGHSGRRHDNNLNGGQDFRPKESRELNYNNRKEHLKENVSAAISPDSHVYESGTRQSHQQRISNFNSVSESSSAKESFRHVNTVSRKDQDRETALESVMINSAGGRSSHHLSNRLHQKPAGQKGVLPSKEWKPKTSQKPNVSSQTDTSKNVETEANELQDKQSQNNISDSQKFILPRKIQAPEFDRCKLNFGCMGMESDGIENRSSANQVVDGVGEAIGVQLVDASPSNNQHTFDNQVQNSASGGPSCEPSDYSLPGNNDSVEVLNTENPVEMNFVHNSSSLATSMSDQLRESLKLSNLSAYNPQPVYDMPHFGPSADDALRGTGLLSNQEAISSHTGNIITDSSVTIPQMYPQVHLSQYTNVTPYRHYIPQLYASPMVPGYMGNPGYPHLPNGSSYVLVPGSASHVPANGLNYGIQQFEPTGYAMNPTGVIGGPTSLDDSSRLKYNDNNLYVQNPQLKTSEVWIQNQSTHPEMQSSTAYFNMSGQTVHHPAYMQSHTAHPSFNTAAQSSQMQFSRMYPPQPAAIPNNHHLGVGVPPSPPESRVQPQINHPNWTTTSF